MKTNVKDADELEKKLCSERGIRVTSARETEGNKSAANIKKVLTMQPEQIASTAPLQSLGNIVQFKRELVNKKETKNNTDQTLFARKINTTTNITTNMNTNINVNVNTHLIVSSRSQI